MWYVSQLAQQQRRASVAADMDRSLSTLNGSICWHFLNGSCRYGSRCHYRHELPAAPPSQICRYFQKGACWYGERCRYIHVPQPESGADVAGHRLSVPTVSPSTFSSSVAAQGSSDRRVSEASALAQADVLPRRQRRTLRSVENSSNVPDAWNQNAEKRLQDIPSRISGKRSEQSCASPHEKEENLPGSMEAAGAAAASSADGTSEAFLQSRDVTCGICMDKCIMTWRKTRDLGADVVNKRSCSYYARNKHCPFETECLFRHDRSARRRSFLCNTDDDDDYDDDDDDDDEDYDGLLNFFIAMTLLRSEEDDDDNDDDDDDDNFDIPFFLAQYGF
ncbi:makorin, ring finger protein, 4 isoform X5 [Syngnathoides biaculeatus]|uniref:makorin, ring finger protein, 4 isoform X5 n=1 Tax=Syngnathoides biaculeatus TaxID=300417 RepID=UPI002ADD57B1|nr:makorin, ring finger protein, 4 isoform X5 [Syngnathoides biaculeatus]